MATSSELPTASPLTEREHQVAILIARGLTNAAVAGELGISEHTVDAHRRSIYEKLGIHSAAELGVYVGEHPAR